MWLIYIVTVEPRQEITFQLDIDHSGLMQYWAVAAGEILGGGAQLGDAV